MRRSKIATPKSIDGAGRPIASWRAAGSALGMALNPFTSTLYSTATNGTTMWITNIATGQVGGPNLTGWYPASVTVLPNVNKFYIPVLKSGATMSVFAYDGASGLPIGRFDLDGGSAAGIAANPNTNLIYAADSRDTSVIVLDGTTLAQVARIPLLVPSGAVCGAGGIAVNTVTNKIYVAGSGQLCVIDGSANTVTSAVSAGAGSYSVAVNESTNTIYVANANEGTVTVVAGDPASAPVTYSISGRIIDEISGAGVAGATVAVGTQSTITDISGAYALTGLFPFNSYTVTVSKPGAIFDFSSQSVALSSSSVMMNFFAVSQTSPGDTVTITRAEYSARHGQLRVEVTSSSTGVITMTVSVTATGQVIGTLPSLGGGKYGATLNRAVNPRSIKVSSSGGGFQTITPVLK